MIDGDEPNPTEVWTSVFSQDARGRVRIQGDQVRRKIVPELQETFNELKTSGRLDRLHELGLVRTWQPESEGDDLLAHEYVPFVTYPQEWTLEMLRAAAVCTLDIAAELADAGLKLHDAHPWNVAFHHDRPVFLDFSSIEPGDYTRRGFPSVFFSGFYLPLWLLNKRLYRLSSMIAGEDHPLGARHGARATGRQLFRKRRLGALCMTYWWRAARIKRAKHPSAALRALRDHVAHMRLPKPKTRWADYYEPGGAYDDIESYSDKAKAVHTLLTRLPKGRLVDLACNHGWFSGLAATMGHCVLGVDLDDNAVNIAREKRARQFGFTVGRMNLLWPTPPQGLFLQLPGALQRWQCDTVLMIALTHHLSLHQSVHFDALAAIPAAFGARHVIIEWIPPDDRYVRRWVRKGLVLPSWYNEDTFVETFARHWPQFEKVQSDVRNSDGVGIRQMYLFRK